MVQLWIVGHRGARAVAPENTLRAIRTGMKCADYVEVDVRLSHDGIPVLIHDARLERTTSGTGQVNDLTVIQLKSLDAGEGETIPTLDEVLHVVTQGECGLVIEIKEPGSEEIICDVIRNSVSGKVLTVSFHYQSLSIMKTCLPDLKTGIIVPATHGNNSIDENWFSFDSIFPRLDFLTPGLIRHARNFGMLVIPWTLNTPGELKKAVRMGVDGVVTDDPCSALQIVRTTGL